MNVTQDNLIRYMNDGLGIGEIIEPETELFSNGLLDSVSMVNLIIYIEEQAKVVVQPSDVTLENFDSVSRIVQYIGRIG